MAKMIDLKGSVNKVLEDNFPKIKVRSDETKEGFKRPCFFTQIVPMNMEYDTVNVTSNRLMVVINYFGKEKTELDNLKMHDEIKKAFGMTLKVNRRSFLLKDIRSQIIDEVLQFRFDLDFFDAINKINKEEVHKLMEELNLEIREDDE